MSNAEQGEALKSPLHSSHEELGAKWSDFGGWLMPLEYAGGGVTAEHEAVRNGVGIFDVSHLGTAQIVGPGAVAAIDAVLTNSLDRIGPGQAQYTLLCNDQGGVIDDIIAYRVSDDELILMPNAANCTIVLETLRAAIPAGVEIHNLHTQTAIIAVQGPRSAHVLDALGLATGLEYMSFVSDTDDGVDVTVCRTGYTGELGFELAIDAGHAVALWNALLAVDGVVPCGLAARDTLRTEMGYPLHGQDLSPTITPVEAGVSWAVGWNKPIFAGKAALDVQRAHGPSRRLVGLLASERGIPRHDMVVRNARGDDIGIVTSGTFSPTLHQGIALALVNADVDGDVVVDVRGRSLPCTIVKPPFVTASPKA